MAPSTGVQYRDRRTGEIVTEAVLYEPLLRWAYGHPAARNLLGLVLNIAAFCWFYGKLQDLPISREKSTNSSPNTALSPQRRSSR